MYLTSQFANSVQNQINNLLADGVMTASVIIGSIFLSSDHLFWMEQLAISTGADLVCKKEWAIENLSNQSNFRLLHHNFQKEVKILRQLKIGAKKQQYNERDFQITTTIQVRSKAVFISDNLMRKCNTNFVSYLSSIKVKV